MSFPARLSFVFCVLAFACSFQKARAQFNFASDNAGNSVYSPSWDNTDNGGTGFGGWGFTTGANSGVFIGNPNSNGINTSAMGTTAFGMFANGSAYMNASRGFSTGLQVGDIFMFDWGINWDANGGSKGFDLKAGGTTLVTIQNSGTSPNITGIGTLSSAYGTGNMAVSITRTTSGYSFSMTRRNDGSTFSGTFGGANDVLDSINFFIGNQNDFSPSNGNRNMFFDNLSITNTGVFNQGGSITYSRALSGSGALSVGNNTTLILAVNGSTTFTGASTVDSGSTLQIGSGAGVGDIAGNITNNGTVSFNRNANSLNYGGVISGSGAVNKSGAGGQINLQGANTYTGATTVSGGSLEIQSASGLGNTSAGTTVNNGASLRLFHNTGLTFDAETLSLTGLGVGSTGALFNAGGANIWTGAISLGADTRIGADTSSTLSINGGINHSSNTLYLGGAGNITIGSNLTNAGKTTGDGALFWDGSGALRLNQATQSGLAGNINLRSGTVLIGADNALGTGAVTVGAGSAITLASADTTARSIGNNITMSTSDRLNLGQSSSGTGNLALGGTLTFGVSTLNHFLNVANSGTTVTVSGIVSGASKNLIKEGAGTLGLSANNTYSGGTYIDAGTLVFSAGTSGTSGIDIGTTAAATASAATLRLSGVDYALAKNVLINTGGNRTIDFANASGTATLNGTVTANKNFEVSVGTLGASGAISGIISGTGALTKTGPGTLILSGANTYNGGTTVSAGTLQIGSGSTAGSVSGTIANSGTVTFNRSDNITYGSVISGTGALTKAGVGKLTLTGANTYSGTTTVSEGTLEVGAGGSTGSINNTAVSLGNGANITFNRSDNISHSGTISGTGGTLTKQGAGILTISGSQTYTGATTVSAGTLRFNGQNTSTATTVQSGASLGGSGSLGSVTINSGGRLAPGNSPGNLTVSSLTLAGGGFYDWEITDATGAAGSGWDVVTVGSGGSGVITLSANSTSKYTINVIGTASVLNWSSSTSRTWDIIDAGSWDTAFDADAFTIATGNFLSAAAGTWSVANNGGNLQLVYTGATNLNAPNAGQSVSQTAAISGGGVEKTGPGIYILDNSGNSYTGITSISEGTLQITVAAPSGSNGAFGNATSAVVVGKDANAVTLDFGAAVANSRDLSIVAGGSRTISTAISSGTATQGGAVAMAADTTYTSSTSGGTLLVSGAISGAGNATVNGSGTVEFSGNNTFTGTTTIANGTTLRASHANALGTTAGNTVVSSGATLALSGGINTGENISITGTGVQGNGALRNSSGVNTNSGTVTLAGNALITADSGTTLRLGNIDNGATSRGLTFGGAGTILLSGNFANTATNTTWQKDGSGHLIISNTAANTAGIQIQMGAGKVTLAAGTFSTNTTTSTRGLDLGLTAGNLGSSEDTEFYVNSGLTMSNTVYVAGGTGTRTMGTESTSGTATYTGEIFLDKTLNISAASGGSVVFSGNIVNTNGGVTKIGAGTATLSGSANTYTGGLTMSAGTLNLNHASAAGTGTFTISGGTIDNTTGSAITLTNNAQNWNGDFTFAGTRDLNLGTGNVAMNASRQVTVTAGNLTVGGVISGAGFGLTKAGNGTLILNAANTYTGTTTITAGTITLGTNGGVAGDLNIGASGTFNLNGTSETLGSIAGAGTLALGTGGSLTTDSGSNTIFSGVISGTGSMTKNGSGTLTLSGGSANTFSGTTAINGGTLLLQKTSGINAIAGTPTVSGTGSVLRLGADDQFAGDTTFLTITNGGLFDLNNFNDSLAFQGNGSINLGTGTLTINPTLTDTFSGVISGTGGNLVKTNIGTQVLSGANTYTGTTMVNGGILRIANNTSLGTTDGATTVSTGAALELSNNITVGAEALTLGGGGISSGGSLRNVSGNNTWQGGITNSNGARINADSGTTLTISGAISNAASQTLSVGGAGNIVLSGNLTMGTVSGGNALVLDTTSTNTISGSNSGLTGVVRVASSGTVLLGSDNALGSGNLTFAPFTTATIASTDANSRTLGNATNYIYGTGLNLGLATTGTGSLTFGAVNLGNDSSGSNQRTINTATGTSHTFGAVAGGANNTLIKAGSGTLILSAASGTTGGFQLNEGTLRVGDDNALGTGTLQIQFDQSGTRTLASSSDTERALTNNVNIYNSVTLGQASGGTGRLTLSGSVALGDPVASTTTRTVTVIGDHSISGVVSGGNGLVKEGSGTLTLSGSSANTYTGRTTVNGGTLLLNKTAGINAVAAASTIAIQQGTLLLGASNQIGDTTAITMSGGTLNTQGNADAVGKLTVSANSTIQGLNSGAGSVFAFSDVDLSTYAGGSGSGSTLSLIKGSGSYGIGEVIAFSSKDYTQWTGYNSSNLTSFNNFQSKISFNNDSNLQAQINFSGGYTTLTVAAIPEPKVYMAAGALALLIGCAEVRRRKRAKSAV